MTLRLRLSTAVLLLAVTLTTFSAGCAKNGASGAVSTPPSAEQMQAQQQAGEAAAKAAQAAGEGQKAAAAAKAAGQGQAGAAH